MKHKQNIILSSIIFMIGLYILSFVQPDIYTNNWWHRILVTLRFLFVNEYGRLNWVGISAIGVLISYGINSKFNRDKLKADIVSQARIKWIQEVRELTSEYIVAAYNVIHVLSPNYNTTFSDGTATLSDGEEHTKRGVILEKRKNELKVVSEKLSLYFGPDKSDVNTEIKKFIYNYSETLINSNGGDPLFFEELRNDSEILRDYLSYYYKIEWRRANGDLADDEVDDELKKGEFKKIVERGNKLLEQTESVKQAKIDNVKSQMAQN